MRMLDLYCGEGLAAWGYWLSGRFTEIVGMDINPKHASRYSFDFLCGDALTLDYDFLMSFDFIHASPPCQAYSKITPDKSKHLRLVAATHLMLHSAGKPYVIENVEGSSRELKPNFVLNGQSVGLNIDRRRYFYVSELVKPVRMIRNQASNNVRIHDGTLSRDELIDAMGLHIINEKQRSFLTKTGIEQGIPPIITKTIAELIFPAKAMIG